MRTFHLVFSVLLTLSLLSLGGCKIQSLEEDRLARQQASGNFDAREYANQIWSEEMQSYTKKKATDLSILINELDQNGISQTGALYGRQAGEGSPWTFIAKTEAIVVSTDRQSRQGTALLDVNGEKVELLIGPVVFSTEIRDSLDFISFNDFANQLDYADFGNALTSLALGRNSSQIEQLEAQRQIKIHGVFSMSGNEDQIRVMPVFVELVSP